MIDDDRHGEGRELDAQCFPGSRASGYEHAPALPVFHPVGGSLQTLFRAGGIGDSLITETQPDAANAAAVHVVERRFRRLVVDHGDAARAAAELADAVDHARVVRSVRRRLHDDHTIETNRPHHLLQLRRRSPAPACTCGLPSMDGASDRRRRAPRSRSRPAERRSSLLFAAATRRRERHRRNEACRTPRPAVRQRAPCVV